MYQRGGNMENKSKMPDYPLPKEVLDILKTAPEYGTPAFSTWLDERFQAEKRNGLRAFTLDESLKAMERERAGYDGLGELWGCTHTSTQM
jgi:hypothetical protein